MHILYLTLTLRACHLNLQDLVFLLALPNADQRYAVVCEQGGTCRGSVDAINRTINSTSDSALSLLGG
jgi:hypothetical protein